MTYEELIKEHLTGPLVKVNDIKKGDLVARVRPGHATIIEVDKNLPTVGGSFLANFAGDTTSVNFDDELRLLNRAMPKLPSSGSIAVWELAEGAHGDARKIPEGAILTHDGTEDDDCWGGTGDNWYCAEQILEWAPLPGDFFDNLRKESIK